MDERRNNIRDLEAKKSSDTKTRDQLLEGLGEILFRRIGDGEPFTNDAGDEPGVLLAEYRKLHKEIDDSSKLILSLEKEVLRLKELEETISAREEEKTRLEGELEEVHAGLGKALLEDPDFIDPTGVVKRQEEALLDRISSEESSISL